MPDPAWLTDEAVSKIHFQLRALGAASADATPDRVRAIARAVLAESPMGEAVALLREVRDDECQEGWYRRTDKSAVDGTCEDFADKADVPWCLPCRARAFLRNIEGEK